MFTKTHAKYIQSLHHKKFRDEYRVFIAEGPKVVSDLLQGGGFVCKQLLATGPWLQQQDWVRQCQIDELLEIKDFELEKISALSQPNQVLAVFEQLPIVPPPPAAGQLSIVLDGLQDPGNLGTIIRTADWFGVPLIVCTQDCADCYNPKVVQSTMGSLGRVQVVYTDVVSWLQQNSGVASYATALEGVSLSVLTPFTQGIIIIGNESRGIRPELMALAHQKITIPKKGGAESLNAAVALGIVLGNIIV